MESMRVKPVGTENLDKLNPSPWSLALGARSTIAEANPPLTQNGDDT
jgi:hypothetical protein